MNSENSKTSDSHRLLLNLTDKINLKRTYKYVPLSSLSIFYTWKNIEKSYKSNKFKIAARTWNEEFELSGGSYSVRYSRLFWVCHKKYETVTDNATIMIYVNKIENRITFKINVLHLEITEAVLIHCNIVHNVIVNKSLG